MSSFSSNTAFKSFCFFLKDYFSRLKLEKFVSKDAYMKYRCRTVISTLTKNDIFTNKFYDCPNEVIRSNATISRAAILYKSSLISFTA